MKECDCLASLRLHLTTCATALSHENVPETAKHRTRVSDTCVADAGIMRHTFKQIFEIRCFRCRLSAVAFSICIQPPERLYMTFMTQEESKHQQSRLHNGVEQFIQARATSRTKEAFQTDMSASHMGIPSVVSNSIPGEAASFVLEDYFHAMLSLLRR